LDVKGVVVAVALVVASQGLLDVLYPGPVRLDSAVVAVLSPVAAVAAAGEGHVVGCGVSPVGFPLVQPNLASCAAAVAAEAVPDLEEEVQVERLLALALAWVVVALRVWLVVVDSGGVPSCG
jgi:hypothetical protein